MQKKYDLIVLGGGPGGYVAAIRAARLGLRAALIERDKLGGTCLNRGCIPTKALLQSAHLYHSLIHAAEFGVRAGSCGFDYAAMASRKDSVVAKLRNGVQSLLQGAGVEILRGNGRLLSRSTVGVDGDVLQARSIILATGARPAIPPIPGAGQNFVLTSDSLLEMTACPQSIIIVGGGVIGVEFAALLSTLGCKVTVLEMLPAILYDMDRDISAELTRALQRQNVTIHTSARVCSIGDRQITFLLDSAEHTLSADYVLLATGRLPCTADIGLEAAGLAADRRGFIKVDDRMQTAVSGIYAIGDITGQLQLAHVASEQGMVAAHNAAGQPRRMLYDVIPACVYTTPEAASVGLTQQAAEQRGIPLKVGIFPVAANGKSMIANERTGFVKLLIHHDTGEILGGHMLCPGATDMIAEIAAAMRAEGTLEELCETIHPHPTVSEMIAEAAVDAAGLRIHKP